MRGFNWELPDDLREALRRATEFQMPPGVLEAAREAARRSTLVPVPPEILEAATSARKAMLELPPGYTNMIREAQRSLAESVEALTPVFPTFPDLRPTLEEVGRILRESWANAMPPNWRELEPKQVMELIDVVRDTGFVLVWIPRGEIIREVLAKPRRTEAILRKHQAEVLEDAAECVIAVVAPELQGIRTAVEKSIAALAGAHDWAAQALASTAFTTECHMLHGERLGDAREAMGKEDPEHTGMSQLRLRTIYLAGNRALTKSDPKEGATDFNRHNSAHRITAAQWNERNALSGVMLATALLREMQYWIELRGAREQQRDG